MSSFHISRRVEVSEKWRGLTSRRFDDAGFRIGLDLCAGFETQFESAFACGMIS